jgi:hypothetical protein
MLLVGIVVIAVAGYFVAFGGAGATAQVALLYPPGADILLDGRPAATYNPTHHVNMPELEGSIFVLPAGRHSVVLTWKDGGEVIGLVTSDPEAFGAAVYRVDPVKKVLYRP